MHINILLRGQEINSLSSKKVTVQLLPMGNAATAKPWICSPALQHDSVVGELINTDYSQVMKLS